MSQPTLNPYPDLGTQFVAGMNAIIAGLPPTPTIDDLANEVITFVETTYFIPATMTQAQKMEVKSVVYSTINSFVNSQVRTMYGGAQKSFADMMIGPSLTSGLTVDSIENRILDIQDNLSENNLSVEMQTPLLLAIMIGQTCYTYWLAQIALGATGAWFTPYFSGAQVSAIANVPYWVAASMEGALIGARSTNRGMIETTTQIVSNEIIQSLIGALTIAAGKVIFLWIPRIQSNGRINGPGWNC
jgi:hypothetical protein